MSDTTSIPVAPCGRDPEGLVATSSGPDPGATAPVGPPTFVEFFRDRYVPHARAVQSPDTRRAARAPVAYLLYHFGDRRLDDIARRDVADEFAAAMQTTGPLTFALNRDGSARHVRHELLRRRARPFATATINSSLRWLRAVLRLAYAEGVIPARPVVVMVRDHHACACGRRFGRPGRRHRGGEGHA